jgi:hypothetical protein
MHETLKTFRVEFHGYARHFGVFLGSNMEYKSSVCTAEYTRAKTCKIVSEDRQSTISEAVGMLDLRYGTCRRGMREDWKMRRI